MTALPPEYAWLASESGPKMIVEALKLYGTLETPGEGDNPTIMAWADETGLDHQGYTHDEVPWCGLFMSVVAQRAGKHLPPVPLRALAWADFGEVAPVPALGDVLVFKRTGGGHVTLYVGEDDTAFHCLGGNQGDAVSIGRKEKARVFAVRRPLYHLQPINVRPIHLAPTGALSTAEA